MLRQFLYVGLGGAAGSILRYALTLIVMRWYSGVFPLATFAINITGSFLIGYLMGHLLPGEQSQVWRLLLVTGFCGGFTTFSAFSYENIQLINNGYSLTAVGYIFASVSAGLLALWLGLKAA